MVLITRSRTEVYMSETCQRRAVRPGETRITMPSSRKPRNGRFGAFLQQTSDGPRERPETVLKVARNHSMRSLPWPLRCCCKRESGASLFDTTSAPRNEMCVDSQQDWKGNPNEAGDPRCEKNNSRSRDFLETETE